MSGRPEARPEPWTIARLLSWTTDYFARRERESPRLCAELLLAHALGCKRLELYTRFDTVPAQNVLDAFRANVKSAADGRPIAYLTGSKEFFSLTFEVTPDVLIPRAETEVLVERTISHARKCGAAAARILDLCTGSGCVAIALARNLSDAAICASDVSPAALQVAERNAARHAVRERIDLRAGDLFAAWPAGGADATFDVIASNPPYIGTGEAADLDASVREHEPHLALFSGVDGLDLLRRIVAESPAHLAQDGQLLLEIGYRQADAVRDMLERAAWRDIVSHRDGLGHARVYQARRPLT